MRKLMQFCILCILAAGVLFLQFMLRGGAVSPQTALPVVLIAGLVMTGIFFIRKEPVRWLRGNCFTLTSLFLLSFFIVSFQIAWDYFLDAPLNFERYFDNEALLVKSVTFSCVCLGLFLCGYFGVMLGESGRSAESGEITDGHRARIAPLVTVTAILTVLFCLNVDAGYLRGGYSDGMNSTAFRLDSYLNRFIYMTIIQIIWNARLSQGGERMALRKYLRLFPWPFCAILLLKVLVVLASGDRGPVISLITLLVFGYLLLSRRKLGMLPLAAGVLVCGMLFSVFKLSGGFGREGDFSQNFGAAAERLAQRPGMESISPFTLELAGSIFAHTLLYEAWENGETHPSMPLIAGMLNGIPAGVTTAARLFHLSRSQLNTSELATELAGVSYGTGTTCAGDALATLGMTGAFLLFCGLGMLFRKLDVEAGSETPRHYFRFIILFLLLANAIRLPRGSVLALLGGILFCMAVLELNVLLSRFQRKDEAGENHETA